MDASDAKLLGSPQGDDRCITAVLDEKVEVLRRLGQRSQLLSTHDALVLLRNSFALLKLLSSLQSAPNFRFDSPSHYDERHWCIVNNVTNT